ncbi:hypothetical protein [Pseudomarimonas salicorniae]|uniref:Uncharacterized protein n=1 Tax=Pseudomarimonas salicorniae TaxID=2933270 RepID=A0ABT0GEP7_9GAMM|nr:hypothetical protein [Lysobacter sp. CAU 1642]MCK7592497.1 hypothetical protein [Lysobacter sp. CAU 1642]
MQANASNNVTPIRSRSLDPIVPPRADRSASQGDIDQWEREIFFQPSLQEAERRAQPAGKHVALLLALVVGFGTMGSALAEEIESTGQRPVPEVSFVESLGNWLRWLFLAGEREQADSLLKSSTENGDPNEGEPVVLPNLIP